MHPHLPITPRISESKPVARLNSAKCSCSVPWFRVGATKNAVTCGNCQRHQRTRVLLKFERCAFFEQEFEGGKIFDRWACPILTPSAPRLGCVRRDIRTVQCRVERRGGGCLCCCCCEGISGVVDQSFSWEIRRAQWTKIFLLRPMFKFAVVHFVFYLCVCGIM